MNDDRLDRGGPREGRLPVSGQGSAHQAWLGLAAPWREAIEAAWRSYRDGGIAVGAVLTDSAGRVIGRGHNQRFVGGSPRALLAHAEMQALTAVPAEKDRPHDSELYTTLHPCPMCLGAVVVARVAHLHVGALDPTWLGIEALPRLNREVQLRWPRVSGPMSGPLGLWLAVLPCLNTDGSLMRATQATAPRSAELARTVARRFQRSSELPVTAEQALERVWDLLNEYDE